MPMHRTFEEETRPDEWMGDGLGFSTGGFEPIKEERRPRKGTPTRDRIDAHSGWSGASADDNKNTNNDEDNDAADGEYYSLEQLQEMSVDGLDYDHREKYLRAKDFEETLGAKRSEFSAWPKWKQTKAKRAAKLF
mmetsp:Transcript_3534/g.4682  ORF Transcript_3534/g.4682 Transcript_3534/m.4682 type:complete len:135 (+) Transcript_3534:130-534(+)|eukprot:CAMPEP_0198140808 /NCGR_PEP_ID=MMETSP1443-20131203/3903_1 /TAXON_ID=186043 /ORGANISM="Entomoneis sp., Strain CCMP2396" /LENGTH=134 /DNA_ID=CAMNT_0043803341 /DNA_START=72 /DNA_END=476 /DNA_ORIENTATION=-